MSRFRFKPILWAEDGAVGSPYSPAGTGSSQLRTTDPDFPRVNEIFQSKSGDLYLHKKSNGLSKYFRFEKATYEDKQSISSFPGLNAWCIPEDVIVAFNEQEIKVYDYSTIRNVRIPQVTISITGGIKKVRAVRWNKEDNDKEALFIHVLREDNVYQCFKYKSGESVATEVVAGITGTYEMTLLVDPDYVLLMHGITSNSRRFEIYEGNGTYKSADGFPQNDAYNDGDILIAEGMKRDAASSYPVFLYMKSTNSNSDAFVLLDFDSSLSFEYTYCSNSLGSGNEYTLAQFGYDLLAIDKHLERAYIWRDADREDLLSDMDISSLRDHLKDSGFNSDNLEGVFAIPLCSQSDEITRSTKRTMEHPVMEFYLIANIITAHYSTGNILTCQASDFQVSCLEVFGYDNNYARSKYFEQGKGSGNLFVVIGSMGPARGTNLLNSLTTKFLHKVRSISVSGSLGTFSRLFTDSLKAVAGKFELLFSKSGNIEDLNATNAVVDEANINELNKSGGDGLAKFAIYKLKSDDIDYVNTNNIGQYPWPWSMELTQHDDICMLSYFVYRSVSSDVYFIEFKLFKEDSPENVYTKTVQLGEYFGGSNRSPDPYYYSIAKNTTLMRDGSGALRIFSFRNDSDAKIISFYSSVIDPDNLESSVESLEIHMAEEISFYEIYGTTFTEENTIAILAKLSESNTYLSYLEYYFNPTSKYWVLKSQLNLNLKNSIFPNLKSLRMPSVGIETRGRFAFLVFPFVNGGNTSFSRWYEPIRIPRGKEETIETITLDQLNIDYLDFLPYSTITRYDFYTANGITRRILDGKAFKAYSEDSVVFGDTIYLFSSINEKTYPDTMGPTLGWIYTVNKFRIKQLGEYVDVVRSDGTISEASCDLINSNSYPLALRREVNYSNPANLSTDHDYHLNVLDVFGVKEDREKSSSYRPDGNLVYHKRYTEDNDTYTRLFPENENSSSSRSYARPLITKKGKLIVADVFKNSTGDKVTMALMVVKERMPRTKIETDFGWIKHLYSLSGAFKRLSVGNFQLKASDFVEMQMRKTSVTLTGAKGADNPFFVGYLGLLSTNMHVTVSGKYTEYETGGGGGGTPKMFIGSDRQDFDLDYTVTGTETGSGTTDGKPWKTYKWKLTTDRVGSFNLYIFVDGYGSIGEYSLSELTAKFSSD